MIVWYKQNKHLRDPHTHLVSSEPFPAPFKQKWLLPQESRLKDNSLHERQLKKEVPTQSRDVYWPQLRKRHDAVLGLRFSVHLRNQTPLLWSRESTRFFEIFYCSPAMAQKGRSLDSTPKVAGRHDLFIKVTMLDGEEKTLTVDVSQEIS